MAGYSERKTQRLNDKRRKRSSRENNDFAWVMNKGYSYKLANAT